MFTPTPRLSAAFVLAGALIAGPAALANPVEEAPSRVVRFADLDLTTPAGKIELQRRLKRAATAVCPSADPVQLATVAIATACRKAALSRVAAKADTAIAAAETRRRYAAAEVPSRPAGL